MITYSNIKRHDNIPFENYLNFSKNGYLSHSFLKRENNGYAEIITPTQKMKLGSLVDAILTSPDSITVEDITNPMFSDAKKIASSINTDFKSVIKNFVPQVSYTGIVEYKSLRMPVCGRLDWLLTNCAVIDLKVTDAGTDAQFAKIIEHFGYENQMFNYCGLSEVNQAFIIPYSTKKRACLSVVKIDINEGINEFWKNKIKLHGK